MTELNEQHRFAAAEHEAEPSARRAGATEGRRHNRVLELPPATVALFGVLTMLAVLLAVRLGPPLLGFKIFGPVDLLGTRAPWSTGEIRTGPAMIPFITDNLDNVFPGYIEMHHRLFAGDLPLWSSFAGAGTPLMALPNLPTLTPSSIWLLLLPTSWSLGFAKLIEVLLAFTGMMLWLRRLGTTWAAGGVAGIFYVGSGFVVAWANWSAQASAACLIPALFFVVERFLQMRTARSALPVAAVVAFLLLSGFPAVAGHSLYAAGAYFLVRLLGTRTRYGLLSNLRTFATVFAAVLLGVGLSAVQLLPSATSLSDTDLTYRAGQFAIQQPVSSFLSAFYPRIFNASGYTGSNPIEAYSFVGFAALALSVLALLAGRWSAVSRGTTVMLAVTLALSAALVWRHGFWTNWLQHFPIFSGNSSGRLRDLVTFSACALGGIGADLLFRGTLPAAVRRRLVLSCWIMVLAGVLGTIAVGIRYSSVVRTGLLAQDAALGLGTVAVLGVAFALLRPPPRPPARGAGAHPVRVGPAPGSRLFTGVVLVAVALIGTATITSVGYFWPLSDSANFYPQTAAITATQAQVKSQRVVNLNSFLGNSGESYGIRTVAGHTFQPGAWRDLLNSIDPRAFTASGASPTNPNLSVPLTSTRLSTDGKLLDRMAANTIVADPGMALPGPLLLPTAKPAPARSQFGTGRVSIATGTSRSIMMTPQDLRGIQVRAVAAVTVASSSMTIKATITDAGGKVLATGLTTRAAYSAAAVQVPIAGEHLGSAAGPLTLTIGVSQRNGAARSLVLAGTGATPGVLIIGSQPDGLTETYTDNSATVWARSTALPRVRWEHGATVVPDSGKRLAVLANPATPDTTVVLSAPGPQPSGQDAAVTVDTDDGDRVIADVDARGSGYLVLADAIQTGWRVQVNGGAAAIVAADHAFGAVFVQTGHSVVSFSYVGKGLESGVLITAASLAVVVGVLVATFWFSRRRRLDRERSRPA